MDGLSSLNWRWRHLAAPIILLVSVAMGRGASSAPIEDLALSGRVVEGETRKPIAGAEVSLGAYDRWGEPRKPEQIVTSDADGRFTLRLRPDRQGERRPNVVVRVRHRDYIARMSQPRSVAVLREDAARGIKPFFDTIELERGEEYRLRVVTPDNESADGVTIYLSGNQNSILSGSFYDDCQVTSDAGGRARVRRLKSSAIYVQASSTQFAPTVHQFNGTDRKRYPGGILPHDLGTLILSRGEAISGRVVGLDGLPIAGVPVQVQHPQTGSRREACSDASGTFRLDRLAPGGYIVTANGHHEIDGPKPGFAYPIKPAFVQLGSGSAGATVELKEVRSVAVHARFVDAKGRPARGCPVTIYGQILPTLDPVPAGAIALLKRAEDEEVVLFERAEAAAWPGFHRLLGPIVGDRARQAQQKMAFQWSVEAEPDADGRVVVRVPKGLSNASIHARDESGAMLYTVHPKPDAQQIVGYAALGVLNEDPAPTEFVALRAASLTVRVVTEDGGRTPEELNVQANIHAKGQNWGGSSGERGADGVYQLTGMVPNQPYYVQVNANGYLPAWVEGVTLPEGGSRDLTLTLSRIPEAAKVGDLAPPILVTTLDGKARSLADYQGRFVLATVWSTRQTPNAMTKIKAIRERYGADERLATLGLNYEFDRETIEAHVKERKIDWPQARLGAEFSRIGALYGCKRYPNSFLIGPDGAIVALNLAENEIEAAVAKALKK